MKIERFTKMLDKNGFYGIGFAGMLMSAVIGGTPSYAQAVDIDFLEKLVAIPSVSADIPEVNRATRFMEGYLLSFLKEVGASVNAN